MKVNFEKINKQNNNVNFEGYKPVKSEFGEILYEFNYPFDSTKFDCYLEVYQVDTDKKGNYFVTDTLLKNKRDKNGFYKLNPYQNKVDLSGNFGLLENEPFAYHYALVEKGTDRTKSKAAPFYRIDAGDYIDSTAAKDAYNIYNIVTPTGSLTTKGGAMKLIMPDFYNVMWTYDDNNDIVENKNYDKIAKSVKTFSNKLGGSLAGLEKDVELGKFDGYSRIISTPIFTDDSLTPHAYWNTNCMQMAQSLGNINNYASLQRKMFSKGLNFVSDGAFVNEGLQGVHFKHVLKWGSKSPYWGWFRINEGAPIGLGVFGKKHDFISHKLVNSPYEFTQDKDGKITYKKLPRLQKGEKPDSKKQYYDPSKPTFIQILDKRLVSDALKNDNQKLIKAYDKLNTDNLLEINTYNDTVIPYSFEINPETYKKNIEVINEANKNKKANEKIKLESYMGTKLVSKFEKFTLQDVPDGVDLWDANKDIVKLNYVTSDGALKQIKQSHPWKSQRQIYDDLEKSNYEVRDYAISSGRYWTKKTNQILNQYVAQNLKGIDADNPKRAYKQIIDNVNKGIFPKQLKSKINENIVTNVLEGEYDLTGALTKEPYNDLVLAGLMDLPLDGIEFGDNLTAVLGSSYISKRATNKESLGASRYEMFAEKNPHLLTKYEKTYLKMDNIYKNELSKAAKEILKNINDSAPEECKIYEGSNATTYGKYILPQLTEDIAKFLIVKALTPNVNVKINNDTGEISYDYKKLKETSIETLGILSDSPEDEANEVLNKLKDGIKNIKLEDKQKVSDALLKSLKGSNAESYMLAEVIVDRMDAGLDWRIDAAKDIADINNLRNGGTNIDTTWQEVTDFWKEFTDRVLEQNRNAYLAAEITDQDTLQKLGGHNAAKKYTAGGDMVKKLLRESGMTSTANYTYYYSSIINLYGKAFEVFGQSGSDGFNPALSHRVDNESKSFFKNVPIEAVMYSYNFLGNHDLPRILHAYMLDTDFFKCDLNNTNNTDFQRRAYRVINDKFFGRLVNKHDNESEYDYQEREKAIIASFDYSKVNPKSVAMAEALQAALVSALDKLYPYDKNQNKHDKLFTALNKSVSDLANGKYKNEYVTPDAFGVKPADVALDLIFEHANYKYGLEKYLSKSEQEKFKQKSFEEALQPALKKLQAAVDVMAALPGMPTIYAGDDTGATGYETATKNIYLQDRNLIRQDWLDPKNKGYEFIQKHYNKINETLKMRSRPELKALNDGAPYNLPIQKGFADGKQVDVSAILRQSSDGAMTISLFNTTGLNHTFNGNYKPQCIEMDSVILKNKDGHSSDFPSSNLAGLRPGIIFHNAKNPDDKYIVKEYDGLYFLKHQIKDDSGNYHDDNTKVWLDDTTLVLYAVPQKRKTIYNKVYNSITSPRRMKDKAAVGVNLSLISS